MKNSWWRFFKADGKAVIMAYDQGGGGQAEEDASVIIPKAVEGGIDGILTNYGVIKHHRKEMGKIGIMLRYDACASAFEGFGGYPVLSKLTVEDAMRVGADGLMCMGWPGLKHDGESVDRPSFLNVAQVISNCDKWGLVAAAEILPFGMMPKDPGLHSVDNFKIACRMGSELGLDCIKTKFVAPASEYKKVVENSFIPILALGGPFIPGSKDTLEYVRGAMDAGCKGVFMGRNIRAHPDIVGFVSAVAKIIHEDASVETAMKEIREL